MNAAPLLPNAPDLCLNLLTVQAGIIVIKATATAVSVTCPQCRASTKSVHSRYRRTLLDLPWQGYSVQIHIQARRFFCKNPECPRQIFAEPLPNVAARYAHKTQRLADALQDLVLLVGAEAAARIAKTFGLLISPDSLLEAALKTAMLPTPTPRVLGIDDFAFRKGRRYGTISVVVCDDSVLIDQERRCPIDLLPDREAGRVEAWLKAHPGVQIVTRDRAEVYRNGITAGAPHAIQVADRFHLLANLTQALQQSLTAYKQHFHRTILTSQTTGQPLARGSPTIPPIPPIPPAASIREGAGTPHRQSLHQVQSQRRDKRMAIWQRAQELDKQGYTQSQIAFEVGVSLRTVSRFLRSDAYPERKARTRSANALSPYLCYIEQQWRAGQQCAARLHRQIQQQGFSGSYGSVYAAVSRLQKGMALTQEKSDAVVPARRNLYSPRQMTWLFLRSEQAGTLPPHECTDLDATLSAVPTLSELRDLTHGFVSLIRRRDTAALENWLAAACSSPFAALKRFAAGLCGDGAAVRASLEHAFSNGPVEGQVNRLKLVKRSMYGAGSFALLKARVLYRPAA